MLAYKLVLGIFALVTAVHAVPAPGEGSYADDQHHGDKCLSAKDVRQITDTYGELFSDFDAKKADRLLADEYQFFSDSLGNFFPNFTLGSVTLPSKAALIEYESKSGPETPYKSLNFWHSCTAITWRWLWLTSPFEIRAIAVLVVVWRDGRWQIQTDYTELNSLAAARDYGAIKC